MLTATLWVFVAAAPVEVAELRWHPVADGVSTGTLITTWVLSEALKPVLAVPACRWCATNGFDTSIRRVFNPSMAPSASGVRSVTTVSDVLGLAVTPLALLGLDLGFALRDAGDWRVAGVDALLIAQAVAAATNLTQLTKYVVSRGRPYSAGADQALLEQGRDPHDANLSFFSGHATFTFAAACSVATVMTMRNYRHAWVAWVVGLPLAATTALLRVAADKHWASDVLVGMAVGSIFGVVLPWLAHRPLDVGGVALTIQPSPGGLGLGGQW